jgi:hypothetical protein
MNHKENKISLSILNSPTIETGLSCCRDLYTRNSHYRSGFRLIALSICALFFSIALILPCAVGAQEIVVNPSLADEQGIKLNALRAIFSMRLRTWPDGTPVRVFVMGDEKALHVKFAKKRLDIYPHQLRYSWDRLVYSGTGQAPTKVGSEKEMLEKVAVTPGAIGYLPENLISEKVHVLNIKTP